MQDNKVKKKSTVSKNDDEKFIEENDDQRVIVFVAIAVLVVIGIVIGLLAGCQKEKENELVDPNKQTEKEDDGKKNEDKVVDYNEEDEDESDNLVTKTTTKSKKKKERKTFTVEFFLLNNNSSDLIDVKEDNKVSPIEPDGYESCEYYIDVDATRKFDFTSKIKENTTIYMECDLITYDVEYVGDITKNTNPDKYDVEDGVVELVNPTTDYVFLGWYLDSTFNTKVTSLKPTYIDYANEKVITLYAKIVEAINVKYHYNYEDTSLKNEISVANVNFSINYVGPTIVVPEGKTFYGWSTKQNDHKIMYKEEDRIILTGDLDLYPVYGDAKIVFQSESEVVEERVYTDEELANVELPTDSDLDMETPTYYVKVDTPTDTSKEVVADETTPTDKQVKISDVDKDKGSAYDTPTIGDNVEEHEKEFVGWETTVPDPTDPLNEIEVPVDEEFEFTEEETVLDAVWDEQEADKEVAPAPPTSSMEEAPIIESAPTPEPEPEIQETPVVTEVIEELGA